MTILNTLERMLKRLLLFAVPAILLCLAGIAPLSCAPDEKITDRHQQALDEEDE